MQLIAVSFREAGDSTHCLHYTDFSHLHDTSALGGIIVQMHVLGAAKMLV